MTLVAWLLLLGRLSLSLGSSQDLPMPPKPIAAQQDTAPNDFPMPPKPRLRAPNDYPSPPKP